MITLSSTTSSRYKGGIYSPSFSMRRHNDHGTVPLSFSSQLLLLLSVSLIIILLLLLNPHTTTICLAEYSLLSVDSLLSLSSSDCSVQVLEKFTFSFSTPYSVLSRALPSSESLPYALQLDQSADIFIESPDVTLYSQTLLISSDGKTIVFRVR